jgi:hypothetical protein
MHGTRTCFKHCACGTKGVGGEGGGERDTRCSARCVCTTRACATPPAFGVTDKGAPWTRHQRWSAWARRGSQAPCRSPSPRSSPATAAASHEGRAQHASAYVQPRQEKKRQWQQQPAHRSDVGARATGAPPPRYTIHRACGVTCATTPGTHISVHHGTFAHRRWRIQVARAHRLEGRDGAQPACKARLVQHRGGRGGGRRRRDGQAQCGQGAASRGSQPRPQTRSQHMYAGRYGRGNKTVRRSAST